MVRTSHINRKEILVVDIHALFLFFDRKYLAFILNIILTIDFHKLRKFISIPSLLRFFKIGNTYKINNIYRDDHLNILF